MSTEQDQSLLSIAGTGQLEPVDARAFHAELLCFEFTRSYRPGWARNAFIERFGRSPPLEWDSDAPARQITPDTFRWVRGRAIKFARAKELGKRR